jgi:hypothetical protein
MATPLARALLLAAIAGVGLAALALAPPPLHAAEGQLLPDLDPETPGQLTILPTGADKHRHWLLGFSAAASNIGAGPLTIVGHRSNTSTPMMTPEQIVSGATPQVVPDVGEMRYVRSPTHNHWHLLQFMRYELRRAGSVRTVVRDRKSGFCLGDRYRVPGPPAAGAPPQPVLTERCGLYEPGLLTVSEGISVGYGDIYPAYVEFQDLPLDGLRAGRYVLVHTVDPEGRLHELSKSNNSSSVLLDIRRRRGTPDVTLLRECPDTARCDISRSARARAAASGTPVNPPAEGREIPRDRAVPRASAALVSAGSTVRLIRRGGRPPRTPAARIPIWALAESGLLLTCHG